MTSPRFGPSGVLPFVAGGGAAAAGPTGGVAVALGGGARAGVNVAEAACSGMRCRGLIFPPPGGIPYLVTTSGDAMIALLPRTSVVKVVGILSSSTQTYSGSLGTSPNRGFLIRSHRVSAGLIATDGSPAFGSPKTLRIVEQPQVARSTTTSARDRRIMAPPIP